MKRLGGGGTANTGLKPGANESLQETEMRPPLKRASLFIRRAWCVRAETFRKELLENIGAGAGEPYRADARRETTEGKARRILNEELDKLGWTGAELAGRAKGDVRKIRIAQRLRAETAATLKWIATELHMGTWTHAANRLSDNSEQSGNQPDLNLCQK